MNRSAQATVGAALSEALNAQWQIMRACEHELAAGSDVEALHRFRVALRTIRALLRLFKKYLPESRALAKELAWLSDALNRARDLDIVAQFIDNLLIVPSERRILTTCLRELLREQNSQRSAVQKLLRGRRYHYLANAWKNYFDNDWSGVEQPTALSIRIETAQRTIALKQSLKLLKLLRAIDEYEPHVLHRVRIHCKRIRYLFEALPQGDDSEKNDAFIKALVYLQRILGENQDAVVIREWFAQWSALRKSNERKADNELAKVWHAAVEYQQQDVLARLPKACRKFLRACSDI